MKRWIVMAIAVVGLVFMMTGCQTETAQPQTVKVGTLAGPTGMGMAEMMVDGVDLGENVTTEFTIVGAPDQLTASLISGELQMAAVPTNLAAVLYNKTEGQIALGSVNTLGVLYIVADEAEGIASIADLKGKTILASGQGSTPEYVLNYLLQQNGLTPGVDVTINYVSEHSEVVTALAAGTATVAMLPEPFVTTITSKKANIKVAVDMTDAWAQAGDGSQLQMSALVVNREWATANPDVFAAFLEAYEKSINDLNQDPVQGAQDIVAAGIMADATVAQAAIPNCNIVFIPAADAQDSLTDYYNVLYGFDPKSLGGSLPGEDFYSIGQ